MWITLLCSISSALATPQLPTFEVEGWVRAEDVPALREARPPGLFLDHAARWGGGGALRKVIASRTALQALSDLHISVSQVQPLPAPPEGYRMPEEGALLLNTLLLESPRSGRAVIGYSLEGRPLDALWLGQPPQSGAPVVRVLGAHHGDEWSSFELSLAVAETLALGDGPDPAITALLDERTVWVVPYINPDGVVAGRRQNARGVDLNRNYGYLWSEREFYAGETAFSEPETQAVRAWTHLNRPALGLSLHSGAVNLGWVWNYTTMAAPDEPALRELATHYQQVTTAPGFWITSGGDWYTTQGDTTDWSYGRYGAWDYTLEVSERKSPAAAEIDTYVADHLPAVLDFLAEPLRLQGQVVDAVTGEPVEAQLAVGDAAPFWTDLSTGRFAWAGLDVGPLRVSAPGYQDAELALDSQGARLRVALDPLPTAHTPTVFLRDPQVLDLPLGAVLTRPGGEPIEVGQEVLDPATLAPGWWTLRTQTGQVSPRAVFVPDPRGLELHDVAWSGRELLVQGEGFSLGTRAWALFGPRRQPVELTLLDQTPTSLRLKADELPTGQPVDLFIASAGGFDASPVVSEASWAPERLHVAGGCATTPSLQHLAGVWVSHLLWLFPLSVLRRHPRQPGEPRDSTVAAVRAWLWE